MDLRVLSIVKNRGKTMSDYKRILLAVDLFGDGGQIIERAKSMTEANNADLYLIHVNEPITAAYSGNGLGWGDQVMALESSFREESRKKLNELAGHLKVPDDRCLYLHGRGATEIHRACEEHDIDLLVMGTHGQAGLQLLLGSTANSVLHGSSCDVLTVRIRD